MIFFFNFLNFPPILLFLHCIFIFLFKKWLGPLGTFYGSIFIFIFTLFTTLNEFYFILLNGNYYYIDFGKWFFCLDLIDSHLVFCIDNLALISSLLVLFLTMLALYFGIEYMYREAFINRLLYLLNLFATSVIFLFFSYDYFLIIFAWESIGLYSFLLVNFYSMRIYTIKAALKTFIFSRISDMFIFITFLLTIIIFNTTDLSLIFIQIPFLSFHYLFINFFSIHFLTFFAFCLVNSGIIKAAQFFFHVWLPDAMEAPTPASALIHSSTLVVAGIFLIIRFSILFEFTLLVNYYLALLGALTLSFGSITAIFQNDIKKLVAYSTISQIGYLVCGCGFCCYEEVLIYLIIHALNKAFLFILVGYIVHFFNGNTDMKQMGGVYIYSFDITILIFSVAFNLAGLPYSAGFFGKEFLLFQILKNDFLSFLIRGTWLVSFFFTPIYMFILTFVVIFGPKKSTLSTYYLFWNLKFNLNFQIFINFKKIYKKFNKLVFFFLLRYEYTLFTSKTTIFILFFFWIFFIFFGEIFYLIILNFSSLNESIESNFFFFLKSHIIFFLFNFSNFLSNIIIFYIIFFTINSFFFILNFKLKFNYLYFFNKYFYNTIYIIFFLFLFIFLFDFNLFTKFW